MSRVITILFISAVAAAASQDNPTKEELLKTVEHIEQIAVGAIEDLNKEKAAHEQTTIALQNAQKGTLELQKEFQTYKDAVATTVSKANAAIAAHDRLVQKLHLAKYIACGIWIGICILVGLKIPGAGLYIGGGLAAAGVALIWIWL